MTELVCFKKNGVWHVETHENMLDYLKAHYLIKNMGINELFNIFEDRCWHFIKDNIAIHRLHKSELPEELQLAILLTGE